MTAADPRGPRVWVTVEHATASGHLDGDPAALLRALRNDPLAPSCRVGPTGIEYARDALVEWQAARPNRGRVIPFPLRRYAPTEMDCMMRYTIPLMAAVALFALSGCTATDQAPAPAAPAPTIVNVQAPAPAADGGLSVLLTLALVGAFVGIIGCVVLGFLWMNERRRRVDSEDVLVELTGVPVSRARVALATRPTAAVGPRVGDLPGVAAHEDRKAIRP